MSMLQVSLLGKFCVHHDGQVLDGLSARKVQDLFSYLLLYRDQAHPREPLAGILWGDQNKDTAQSKKCLRQVLWQLQAVLESRTGPNCNRILLIEPEWVQLNSNADLWLDVAALERASLMVQGIPGEALDDSCLRALEDAVNLYQGDLLEGWYQDWCLYERERLQSTYLAMLDKLMGYCEAHHEYEKGLAYGARILHCDRARERTHRRLMRLYYLSGDRTASLRQYETCVAALKQELGVQPAQSTVALHQEIQADSLDGAILAPVETISWRTTPMSPLSEIRERLAHLQAILATAQLQVQQDIQTVDRALKGKS